MPLFDLESDVAQSFLGAAFEHKLRILTCIVIIIEQSRLLTDAGAGNSANRARLEQNFTHLTTALPTQLVSRKAHNHHLAFPAGLNNHSNRSSYVRGLIAKHTSITLL